MGDPVELPIDPALTQSRDAMRAANNQAASGVFELQPDAAANCAAGAAQLRDTIQNMRHQTHKLGRNAYGNVGDESQLQSSATVRNLLGDRGIGGSGSLDEILDGYQETAEAMMSFFLRCGQAYQDQEGGNSYDFTNLTHAEAFPGQTLRGVTQVDTTN